MKRRFAMIALAIALGVGALAPRAASARNRWQDVIAPASRRGGRLAPVSDSVERDLLEGPRAPRPAPAPDRIAPRSRARAPEAAAPAPDYRASDSASVTPAKVEQRIERIDDRPRPSRVLDHTAGDRLREALVAAQDDPKSVAHINRLIAQAAAEARRNKALGERVWYWRDPFSPNPRRPIVLSLETQLEMQVWQARQEAARAHLESAAARNEAAMAHVEAARARTAAAHAQTAPSGRNGAMVAHQNRALRPADDDATPARMPRHAAPAGALPGGDTRNNARARPHAPRPPAVSTSGETELARNDGSGAHARHRDIGATTVGGARTAPPAEAPASTAWRSSDPRGIVVVPINTPVAARR